MKPAGTGLAILKRGCIALGGVWMQPRKSDLSQMDYRKLGRFGLVVSKLALGTMSFRTRRWGTDLAGSHAVFDAYVEAGGKEWAPRGRVEAPKRSRDRPIVGRGATRQDYG